MRVKRLMSENGSSYATSSIGQRDAKDCLATFASSCTPGQPPRGGGVVVARRGDGDGAAAGVFQIITSSCGGGGLPW